MDFTSTIHFREFFRVGPPAVPTVKGVVGGLLFSLGDIGKRYSDVAAIYTTTEFLSLFSIFVVGFTAFE